MLPFFVVVEGDFVKFVSFLIFVASCCVLPFCCLGDFVDTFLVSYWSLVESYCLLPFLLFG